VISAGQKGVGTTASTLLVIPPGPCSVTLYNSGTVTAWLGVGTQTTVTSSNGFPLPSGGYPVTFPGFPGGQGTPLQAVVSAGTISSLGFILSAASGGTGP
jgi:hypothetical protein